MTDTGTFRPSPGQVALIEPAEGDGGVMTGLVLEATGSELCRIDLGASGPLPSDAERVVISVFAPDALYRLHGVARPTGVAGVVTVESVHEAERVQRRTAPRLAVRLGAALAGDGAEPVAARTLDLGAGGLRVETLRPVPADEVDVTVTLPGGRVVRGRGRVLGVDVDGDSHEYRLAFTDLSPADAAAIEALVGGPADVARPA